MNKFLFRIYAYKFFEDFVLIYPLYAVMFTDKGMEPWQVGALLTVWSVTAFLLEIPSGAWADKYSRKKLLFTGQLIRSIGYLIWLFFPGFWGFLAGFVFWGIESALSSGTFEALVYDELKQFGRAEEFTKIIGRTNTTSMIAILVASFLASPAIFLGYPAIIILSSAAVLAAAFIIITLPEASASGSVGQKAYLSILQEGIGEVVRNRAVFRLILFLALATALPGALDEYWTIFADQAGLPEYGLGIFIGLLSGTEAIAGLVAYRFENKPDTFFFGLFLVTGLLLLLAGWLFSVPALLLLIAFSFLATFIQLVFSGRIQHAIPSGTRATISSVNGFFTETGALIVFFSFGLIAQEDGYRQGFLAYGLIISLIAVLFLVFGRRRGGR